MEKFGILMIILGTLLIALFVAAHILDRIRISRRKKFAAEIDGSVKAIEEKISEIEGHINIGVSNLHGIPEDKQAKCLAEFARLKINLSNLRKGCERILKSVESEEMYNGKGAA